MPGSGTKKLLPSELTKTKTCSNACAIVTNGIYRSSNVGGMKLHSATSTVVWKAVWKGRACSILRLIKYSSSWTQKEDKHQWWFAVGLFFDRSEHHIHHSGRQQLPNRATLSDFGGALIWIKIIACELRNLERSHCMGEEFTVCVFVAYPWNQKRKY